MSNGKSLSTREWLLVIVILMGAQFFLHSVSYLYSGSANALGYVSFAGTIVSILLGLIAIIYSFVQSISHGGSVRDVKEQAALLVEAGKDIVVSKDMLSQSAVRVADVVDDLIGRINENTTATNNVASEVIKIGESFGGGVGGYSGSRVSSSLLSLLESKRVWIIVMVICVGEAVKRKWRCEDIDRNIVSPLVEILGEDINMSYAMYFTVLMCLEAEGYLTFSGDNSIESIPNERNELTVRIDQVFISNIDRDDHECFPVLKKILNELG